LLGKLENTLHASPYIVDDIRYAENVELIVYVHIVKIDNFKEEMINLTSDQIDIKEVEQKYVETEISVKNEE